MAAWQAGDLQARDRVILANQRLVYAVCRALFPVGYGDDEIQQGMLGLAEAASRFDPAHGVRFSTYAVWWIRMELLRWMMDRGPVKFSGHVVDRRLFWKLRKAQRLLGASATPETIARIVGVDPEDVRRFLPRVEGFDPSFDAPEVRGTPALRDRVQDSSSSPEESVLNVLHAARMSHEIRRAVRALPARERYIVQQCCLRAVPRSLKDVGNEWGVSRERARQVFARAVGRLQRNRKLRAVWQS